MERFETLVTEFHEYPELRKRILFVLSELPSEIQESFLDDGYFRISLDRCEYGKGRTVLMPDINPQQGESRCVVLKPVLDSSSKDFAHYIIAHELAHAVLRNGGWGEIDDREEAADALAASWGFQKTGRYWFN